LRLKVRRFADLFDPKNAKTSFQNRLLVYLLYKCGGFVPSCLDAEKLAHQYFIPPRQIIQRHGTHRDQLLQQILSKGLYKLVARRRKKAINSFAQSDDLLWSGGYFDFPGKSVDAPDLTDQLKQHWRKEYLPNPTALVAAAFCASVSGALVSSHGRKGRLRATLHRTLSVGNQSLLQQTCDYNGVNDKGGAESTAARTFPAENATIGMAYKSRRIVRSVRRVSREALRNAMGALKLHTASREMSPAVTFVLAIPILQPEVVGQFLDPSPVAGVIYIDSTAPDFFVDDKELKRLVLMTQQFLNGTETYLSSMSSQRIRNVPLTGVATTMAAARPLPSKTRGVLELVEGVQPPTTQPCFQFNLDYSDFVPHQNSNRHR
jgi:hypothetical protein